MNFFLTIIFGIVLSLNVISAKNDTCGSFNVLQSKVESVLQNLQREEAAYMWDLIGHVDLLKDYVPDGSSLDQKLGEIYNTSILLSDALDKIPGDSYTLYDYSGRFICNDDKIRDLLDTRENDFDTTDKVYKACGTLDNVQNIVDDYQAGTLKCIRKYRKSVEHLQDFKQEHYGPKSTPVSPVPSVEHSDPSEVSLSNEGNANTENSANTTSAEDFPILIKAYRSTVIRAIIVEPELENNATSTVLSGDFVTNSPSKKSNDEPINSFSILMRKMVVAILGVPEAPIRSANETAANMTKLDDIKKTNLTLTNDISSENSTTILVPTASSALSTSSGNNSSENTNQPPSMPFEGVDMIYAKLTEFLKKLAMDTTPDNNINNATEIFVNETYQSFRHKMDIYPELSDYFDNYRACIKHEADHTNNKLGEVLDLLKSIANS